MSCAEVRSDRVEFPEGLEKLSDLQVAEVLRGPLQTRETGEIS
jgi:hypothetical protein